MRTSSTRLKAHLGKFLRAVRDGKEIVITDRDRPVARLVPAEPDAGASAHTACWRPRDPSAPPLGKLKVVAISYRGTSTTELLDQDRSRR